jgi:hypothetical protein
VKFSFCPWSLVGLFTCFTWLSVQAADYCLRPGKEDGTEASSVVCCTTPAGWQGWKDNPHYWDGVEGFTRTWLQASHISSVSFRQPNCKGGPQCVFLDLKTTGRDSRGQPDVDAGLRDFLDELEQPQDLSRRDHPCVVVNRFGSFRTENSGVVTIWRIGCPSGRQHLVTLLAQRDVLLTIDLGGPDIKDIVPRIDSLKELARSVRITKANSVSPDIISINVRLPDQAIRGRLLQLTPVGTSADEVCRFLESPRLLRITQAPEWGGELHWVDDDLWTEIGHYQDPIETGPVPKPTITTDEAVRAQPQTPPIHPPTTIVKAVWKFDKERKLRDIKVERSIVEFKAKQ